MTENVVRLPSNPKHVTNEVKKIARERYVPIVKHHMPHCDGEELSLRCALLLMRDQAASRLDKCSEEAWPTLNEVNRLATLYAYRRIPLEELRDLRQRLIQLTMCASGLEMFAYRLACPEAGGSNAGG